MSFAAALAGGIGGAGKGLVEVAQQMKEEALLDRKEAREDELRAERYAREDMKYNRGIAKEEADRARTAGANEDALRAIHGGGFEAAAPPVQSQYGAMQTSGGPTKAAAAAIGAPIDFSVYERKYGLPEGFLEVTAMLESTMGKKNDNPDSSAGGPFQFVDETAAEFGLDGKKRYDWGYATDAASRLAVRNMNQFAKALGRKPTASELYLAHQQGGGGAVKLLRNPGARAADIVGIEAVKLNGGNPNMTAGEFAGLWINNFNGTAADMADGGWNGAAKTIANADQINDLIVVAGNPDTSAAVKTLAVKKLEELSGKQTITALTNQKFIAGPDGTEVLAGYNTITGRMEPILDANGNFTTKAKTDADKMTFDASDNGDFSKMETFWEDNFQTGSGTRAKTKEGAPTRTEFMSAVEGKQAAYIAKGKKVPSLVQLAREVAKDYADKATQKEVAEADPVEGTPLWQTVIGVAAKGWDALGGEYNTFPTGEEAGAASITGLGAASGTPTTTPSETQLPPNLQGPRVPPSDPPLPPEALGAPKFGGTIGGKNAIPLVTTKEMRDALPKGTQYRLPDGTIMEKQ